MLQHFNLFTKLSILISIYFGIGLVAYFLYEFTLCNNNLFIALVVDFIQCWNFILVGFFFFQTFKYARLPGAFYKKRKIETETWFNILGVHFFRWILVNSFFRKLNKRVYLKGKSKEYFKIFIEETKQSETSHLLSFLATLIVQWGFICQRQLDDFLYLTTFSILFNIYPMLLQRKNRFSIQKKYAHLL